MEAESKLNHIERIIQGNPHCHAKGWEQEINRRATEVRKEICNLRRFAFLNLQSRPAEYCLSRAAFLEDRLNELLDQYQKGV